MSGGYDAVVVGVSAGGQEALDHVLSPLPVGYPLVVVVVQHIPADAGGLIASSLDRCCALRVKDAADKEPLKAGTVYVAPAGYHLLVEEERIFSLSVDELVNWARPSIDVLFESAADVFEERLVGVILTGANGDGSEGLRAVKEQGGLAVVQDPQTARVDVKPRAALEATEVDHVVDLDGVAALLLGLSSQGVEQRAKNDDGIS